LSVRFVYFDEVKPNPGSFPDYLIAGISVDSEGLRQLSVQFKELRASRFKEMGVSEGTEVHAQNVYHGKGAFKGKSIQARIGLLADVLKLLEPEAVRLVYVRIHIDKLYKTEDAMEKAFTHFCERAHNTLAGANVGMMIGDLDRATRNQLWTKFALFRENGTPWAFGQELPKFIDTVHFVDSRVCEMVQIADVYAFHCSSGPHRSGYAAELMARLTKGINLFPKSYKNWPNT
jgi:hypothetical protein